MNLSAPKTTNSSGPSKVTLSRWGALSTAHGLYLKKDGYADQPQLFDFKKDLLSAVARHPETRRLGAGAFELVEYEYTAEVVDEAQANRYGFRVGDSWARQAAGGGLVTQFGPFMYMVKPRQKAEAYVARYPSTHKYLTAELVPVRLSLRVLRPGQAPETRDVD